MQILGIALILFFIFMFAEDLIQILFEVIIPFAGLFVVAGVILACLG